MHRKISDRILANDNQTGKTKAMSAVDAFGPQEAAMFARKMIETESRGNGDQMNAMERVAGMCGLTARQLRRFLSGEIKDPSWRLIYGVRIGFQALLESKLATLEHNLKVYKARYGSDHFQDLDAEFQALAQKVETRKGGIEE